MLTDRRGKTGETAAAKYLKRNGVKILLKNVRVGPGEVDLICRQEETLVFVEVKARQHDAWERPSEAVDKRKRRLLNQCADAYLKELRNPEINVRFDIVEVKLDGDEVMDIQWLPNAFGPKDL
ncbi:MAG: YraN family protein [Verrucomicrobiota bacterium]